MGNHGILVIGDTVADTFNRLYYFERAAETYVRRCRPDSRFGFFRGRSPKGPPGKSRFTPDRRSDIWRS